MGSSVLLDAGQRNHENCGVAEMTHPLLALLTEAHRKLNTIRDITGFAMARGIVEEYIAEQEDRPMKLINW